MSKIKVGIIGVGSCAKSLVEGVQYYNENPDDKVGLMYPEIGGYRTNDIEFVCGFDIDKRKVNKKLHKALRAKPNCSMNHVEKIDTHQILHVFIQMQYVIQLQKWMEWLHI